MDIRHHSENTWIFEDHEGGIPPCPLCTCPLETSESGRGYSHLLSHCPGCNLLFAKKWLGPLPPLPGQTRWRWHLRIRLLTDQNFGQTFDKPAPYCLIPWRAQESSIKPDAEFVAYLQDIRKRRRRSSL